MTGLVTLGAMTLPASAQMVQPIPAAGDPVNALSAHLRTLAANPRNLSALLGAGQSALDVGDPNAALGFFVRAGEIDPRSGAAKAGLGSALVQLEKPDDALRLFGEAVSLGMPESLIAKDRGLAYDLRGDNRRAQRDYVLALRGGPDDEVTKRYALSLGISGDRSQAMTLLDPLLRKQDQAAWRARAFILAMTNDVPGANAIAQQVMPANLAGTMSPFLSRLGRLNAAERAHAVNFGTMPSDGQTFASVQIGDPFRPMISDAGGSVAGGADSGLIPSGAPLGRSASVSPTKTTRKPLAQGRERVLLADTPPKPSPSPPPAPQPGFSAATEIATPARVSTRIGTRIAAVDPTKLPPEARGDYQGIVQITKLPTLPPPDTVRAPVVIVAPPISTPVKTGPAPPPPSVLSPASSTTITTPLPPPPVIERDPGVAPGLMGPPAAAAAPPFEVVTKLSTQPAAAPVGRLASILAGVEPEADTPPVVLPTLTEIRATKRAAARKAAAVAEAAAAAQTAKEEKAKEVAAAKANPARLWIQVATGNNERGLGTTWRRIRDTNVALLKPYGGYSVPFKATNRVLAGPVRSSADARALVAALGKAGVSATTYSSEAGQEVAKLGGK